MKKNILYFSLIVILIVTLSFVELFVGSTHISIHKIIQLFLNPSAAEQLHQNIIYHIRFPRMLTAILCGVALSVSGLLMQTFFRNPLASPSILGITAGASLGIAFVIFGTGSMSVAHDLFSFGTNALISAASLGAIFIMLIILLVSRFIRSQTSLLIVGLMIGNLTISLVSIWQYLASPEQIKDYLFWTFGSLSGVEVTHLPIFFGVVAVLTFFTFLVSKYLNLWLLGNDYAKNLGVNIFHMQFIIIALTSVLSGTVTAFCGIIGFVGLSVPHLARFLFDTPDHRVLIPASALLGACTLLGCDLISKLFHESIVLPINIITSLFGSPIVLIVILKSRKRVI